MTYRVMHLITRLPVGGAERLLAGVVSHLDRDRYESVVCCIQDGGAVADEIAASGIPVITLDLMGHGGFDRRVVPALCDIIRRERIDLIHSHLYHANLYGRLAASRAGIAAVASVHNTYSRRKWYRHLINWWLARKCAAVIAVSADIRDDILQHDHVPSQKVIVVPNGIDMQRVVSGLTRGEAKIRLGYAADVFLLGCVGRLEEQKGHAFLITALSALRTMYPQLRLAIAGDGRKRQALGEMAAQMGVADIVQFLGTRSDMADVLRAFDLYVMPSLWEGLSLAMLEAMAAELPVIISDVGGAAEVLGDDEFGIRVPPGDAEALALAIRQLIDSPSAREELATKARRRVADRYDAKAMIKKLEGIYAAAIKGNQPCVS